MLKKQVDWFDPFIWYEFLRIHFTNGFISIIIFLVNYNCNFKHFSCVSELLWTILHKFECTITLRVSSYYDDLLLTNILVYIVSYQFNCGDLIESILYSPFCPFCIWRFVNWTKNNNKPILVYSIWLSQIVKSKLIFQQ